MKTINFLTSHFIPENNACTPRVLSFVLELEKNYKVNIICLSEKGVVQKKTKVVFSKNITIYYVNQKAVNGKNFFLRAKNEVQHLIKLVKLSKTLPSDIVIATSPYMFMIPLVGFGIKGIKVLDIRDLVWEYLDEESVTKKTIKKTLTMIMKMGIKQFDQITVTNEHELFILAEKYNVLNVDVVLNGISRERYMKLITIESSADCFTVTYVGNIGLAQNIKVLIDAARQLPDVKFLIIGGGIEEENIKKYTKEQNISNIEFTGKLHQSELEQYYEKSSVLYAQLDEKYISAMPSKLYEYAALGLPIIYGGIGQAKKFLEKLENSIVIKPNNTDALVNAIKQMKEKSCVISQKNRELIEENYLRDVSAQKVFRIIDEQLRIV